MTRRQLLRSMALVGVGLAGPVAVGCGTTSAPATRAQNTAPAATSGWDALLAAARGEGKVVVSGPPDPGASTKLPEAFKKFSGIDMEYLAGSSSQLASRIQSERAAGQYSIDVSLSGADTVYGTFLANGWLEPLKPVLVLPEVLDGRLYRTGEPWFRDAEKRMVMQIFNSGTASLLTLNTQLAAPDEFKDSSSLLDPRWHGKICAYDPGVNGAGIAIASAIYVTKGKDYATQLFKGQQAVLSRDYQQVADWVAHGNYPIGIGVTHQYLVEYYKAAIPLKEMNVSDIPQTLGGGFGLVNLWTNAPHANAARVFVNWIASKDGVALYGELDGQVPVRNDVDPKWVQPDQIPQPGGTYFDTYEPDYVVTKRQEARDFYASILH
ncbi:MAG: ABC transporter substrate-binding protein [Chloroflexi bacterium]|nr:ABC transporter substrate-binding protein [Chloroflexota bacterium]